MAEGKRFFRVRNWDNYQVKGRSLTWLKLYKDVFKDPAVFHLGKTGWLGWIVVLVAARDRDNHLPWSIAEVNRYANVKGIRVPLDEMLASDLIEEVDAQGNLIGKPDAAPAPASEAKPKKGRKPVGVAQTAAEMALVDSPENREGVDDIKEILSKKAGYTVGNLGYFERLRAGGYTREQWRAVLTALRDGTGSTAKWAKENDVALDYVLRPGDKGGFDKILSQIGTAPRVLVMPPRLKSETLEEAREREKREAEELGKRLLG